MQCPPDCTLQNTVHTCACFLALRTRIRESGPMPLYATPILGVSKEIFLTVDSSTSVERNFFSVAITTPLTALIPSEVAPPLTAFKAYSICTNLPLGLKVVKEKEYCAPNPSDHATESKRACRYAAYAVEIIEHTGKVDFKRACLLHETLHRLGEHGHRSRRSCEEEHIRPVIRSCLENSFLLI